MLLFYYQDIMTPEEEKEANNYQSQAITETIKTNPLKHAVVPEKKQLKQAIVMGEKLKKTEKNQISITLDRFEKQRATKRRPTIQD